MEERLVQQEKVRNMGTLAMGIVHDLNNVLGSLVMRFDVLQRDAAAGPARTKNVDLMGQILRSLTARVRSLHALVRAPTVTTEVVDLGEIVGSAVEIVESGFLNGSEQ